MNKYTESVPLAMPGVPFAEAEKVTPSHAGGAILAVIGVPLAAGLAGGVIMLALAVAMGAPSPWRWSAAGLASAGAVALGVMLSNIMAMIQERQTIIGQSAATPAPAQAVPRIQLEIDEPSAGRWRLVDLPGVSPAQLAELARGLVLGRPFSESEWTGHGRPFSKPAFVAMRAELLQRGIAEPRNVDAPAQGYMLTPAGRAVMARVAELAAGSAEAMRTHAQSRTPARLSAGDDIE